MKQIKILYSAVVICFLGLIARLYIVMIQNGAVLKGMAENQQNYKIELNGGRGNIYDKNLLSFTAVGKKRVVVVVRSNNEVKDLELLQRISKEKAGNYFKQLKKDGIVYVDVHWDFNEHELAEHPNACVLEDAKRYADSGEGAVTLGYLQDGEGVCGIEFACNTYLNAGDGYTVNVCKDAFGKMLPGLSFTKEKTSGKLLKTTLNKKYMRICQDALEDKVGAAVLLDVETFDVVAMVSSPTFNPNSVEEYLDEQNYPFLNRATAMYDMGSIFKIVVLAAALENKSVKKEDVFACNGGKMVGNVSFSCKNHPAFEKMTVEQAFLHSCNAVFIDIGQKTEYNSIIDMAMSFGLGENLIHPIDFPQNKGVLPDSDTYYQADLANLSIGQGKLLGTALHGAVFSAVIAGGGERKSVNIVDCLLNYDLSEYKSLRNTKSTKVLSPENAEIIKELMIKTVQCGTGQNALSDVVDCGGKTGSAQTGILMDGKECVHGWFTGFFPAEQPKYALCVFVENGRSGAQSAAPVFKNIQEKIAYAEGWVDR